jgi:hypothetical protein
VDKFSFFFAFYSLVLGLALTELLGGFGGMVRAHAVKRIEAQTALLALLVFISICATWIDAWTMTATSVSLNLRDLWAPILLATAYYLGAVVVFPREHEQFAHLHLYFAARKKFVVGMLFAAVQLEGFANRTFFEEAYNHRPAIFWAWLVPYNALIDACFIALFFVRGRRANVVLLAALILLVLIPYWSEGTIDRMAMRLWG